MALGSRSRLPTQPGDRDLQQALGKARTYGLTTRDPENPVEGYLWTRSDLDPPELRVKIDGTTWKLPFKALTYEDPITGYAEMYVQGGTTVQSGITTSELLTCFSSDGSEGQSGGGVTINLSSDSFTVDADGNYGIAASISFNGSAATAYRFHIAINGVDAGEIEADVDITAANKIADVVLLGIIALEAGDELSILVEADGGGGDVTVVSAAFIVERKLELL